MDLSVIFSDCEIRGGLASNTMNSLDFVGIIVFFGGFGGERSFSRSNSGVGGPDLSAVEGNVSFVTLASPVERTCDDASLILVGSSESKSLSLSGSSHSSVDVLLLLSSLSVSCRFSVSSVRNSGSLITGIPLLSVVSCLIPETQNGHITNSLKPILYQ
jgi:hypothetical protein